MQLWTQLVTFTVKARKWALFIMSLICNAPFPVLVPLTPAVTLLT